MYLYDTACREVRKFRPLSAGSATIYVCGATVQGLPHVGHLRGGLNFDILRRWLVHGGLDVLLVRNVTDIDNKILSKAASAGRPWWEWAATHERAFEAMYETLGCLPASAAPRATGHITEMVELIDRLIIGGHAYPDPAGSGDVYFSVLTWPEYGALSGQRIEEMEQGESSARAKRDPRDFTLWKSAQPGEPSWPTPWGRGRPGWHLECSAMATHYLGTSFDIHGGGLDLVFPHHENERAQSNAAGDSFARFWLHNGWVTQAGEKMSKSLGNTLSLPEVLRDSRPVELRYHLVAPHYRSTIEFSRSALAESVTAYRRIESFLTRIAERTGAVEASAGDLHDVEPAFAGAMDDDLGTPSAIAALHERVRAGNTAIDANRPGEAREAAASVRAMTGVLGIDPYDPRWRTTNRPDAAQRALNTVLNDLLVERTRARAERDFARADAIRDRLTAAGVSIKDTAEGPTWALENNATMRGAS